MLDAVDTGGAAPDVLRDYVLYRRRFARWALDAELVQLLTGAGLDANDLCARELTARVADLNTCELLQTIAMGRKDATIDLFHGSLVGRIWCMAGEIVDAASGRLAGEQAVYRILALDEGEVVADFRPVRRRRVIASSTLTLMLEASRRKDESAQLEKQLGGAQCAYRTVPGARVAVEAASPEGALLAAFEAGARIESVLASSELDDLAALQTIARLVARGALVATELPPAVMLLNPQAGMPQVRPADMPARLPWPVRRRRSAWRCASVIAGASGAVVALSLLFRGGGALPRIGSSAPRETAPLLPPAATPAPSPYSPARAPADPSPEAAMGALYRVQVIVEPARAELWLDGIWKGTGEMSMDLDRSGQTHELRIAAPDYQPQTLLFRDTPPPLAVRLLPAPR